VPGRSSRKARTGQNTCETDWQDLSDMLTSAHPVLFCYTKNRIHLFSPYQNARIHATFYAIKNLKLLLIFSWFIGFIAFLWYFFCDYIIHPHSRPTRHCPPQWASIPNTIWCDVYMYLLFPPSQASSGAPSKSMHLPKIWVVGSCPSGCMDLGGQLPSLMYKCSSIGWYRNFSTFQESYVNGSKPSPAATSSCSKTTTCIQLYTNQIPNYWQSCPSRFCCCSNGWQNLGYGKTSVSRWWDITAGN